MYGHGRLTLGLFLFLGILLLAPGPQAQASPLNSSPPATPVRLVFIHHSVGANWLSDDNGNLLRGLNTPNQYYVSDSYYGWGPLFDPLDPGSGTIGDRTDMGHWYDWFLGSRSSVFLGALYPTSGLTPDVSGSNSIPKPAGDNTVVIFKSCFVSGYVITGDPGDPPRQSSPSDPNPIWGAGYGDPAYTVSNIKGMYRDLLPYFAAHQDKLFILIATPPSSYNDPDLTRSSASRLRAINTWLVRHWLDSYRYHNVAVFDFYNVLTSNGGDQEISDLGATAGNHHRLRDGSVQHVIGVNYDFSAYATGTDSHPSAVGGQKATGEFLPLLNVAYHAWKGDGGRPWFMGRSPAVNPSLGLLLLD